MRKRNNFKVEKKSKSLVTDEALVVKQDDILAIEEVPTEESLSDVVISEVVIAEEVAKLEKEKKPKPKLYFNSDTQAAIVAYQATAIKKEKDKLYVTEILPAFQKLTENLINIHKFTSLHDTYDDLKNDCINFLFETLYKFDATRGTNAFSYFNVVAKNWLIIKTKQKTQRVKRSVSLDDMDALSSNDQRVIEEFNFIPSQDDDSNEFSASNILTMLYDVRTKVKSENELSCINSIITIFENIDDVDLLNKSAVLLYMRELSGLSPKQLTTTMQTIKKHYKKFKADPKQRSV